MSLPLEDVALARVPTTWDPGAVLLALVALVLLFPFIILWNRRLRQRLSRFAEALRAVGFVPDDEPVPRGMTALLEIRGVWRGRRARVGLFSGRGAGLDIWRTYVEVDGGRGKNIVVAPSALLVEDYGLGEDLRREVAGRRLDQISMVDGTVRLGRRGKVLDAAVLAGDLDLAERIALRREGGAGQAGESRTS